MDPTKASESGDEEYYDIAPAIFADDDDSGSSYRAPSESADEKLKLKKRSRDSSRHVQERITTDDESLRRPSRRSTPAGDKHAQERTKADAARWTTTFEPPAQDADFLNRRRRVSTSPLKPRANSKRKASLTRITRSEQGKKLKVFYNDDYRKLLNTEINAATSNIPTSPSPLLPASQIGSSHWTSAEKDTFFTALSRLGRSNTPGIAASIGTKSALQVEEYLDLLHHGLVKHSSSSGEKRLHLTDFPCALEVSQECCEILEQAGDALALRQERYEEAREKAKWGADSWLLTADVNSWVEDHLVDPGGAQAIKEVLPAAELLNLGNWLEVSTRVFMNPAERKDENWREIIQPWEEHGIRATAFSDFHNLALSITKRLVSATIFCAMSRLRAMDHSKKKRPDMITATDVEAATETIGLKLDSHEFWMTCARRNHLQVFEKLLINCEGKTPMEFDEVEEQLSRRRTRSRSRSRSRSVSSRATSPASTINATDIDMSSDDDGSVAASHASGSNQPAQSQLEQGYGSDAPSQRGQPSTRSYQPSIPIPPRHPQIPSASPDVSREEQYLAYIDAFDMAASNAEEARLWTLLKQEPPFIIKDAELGSIPRLPRKEKDDMGTKDWRESVEYWSPWETFERLPGEGDFTANERLMNKRKRLVRTQTVDGRDMVDDVESEEEYVDAEDAPEEVDQELEDIEYNPEEAGMEEDIKTSHEYDEAASEEMADYGHDTASVDMDRKSALQGDDQDSEEAESEAEASSDRGLGETEYHSRDAEMDDEERDSAGQGEQDPRYASPVITNTQLDDFLSTKPDMYEEPGYEMQNFNASEGEEEAADACLAATHGGNGSEYSSS